MSVSGTLSRTLELCTLRWERHIPEQGPTSALLPGWNLNITLPFINVDLSSSGSHLPFAKRFLRKPGGWIGRQGGDLYYGGFGVGFSVDNGNDGELGQSGDCTVLG